MVEAAFAVIGTFRPPAIQAVRRKGDQVVVHGLVHRIVSGMHVRVRVKPRRFE